MKQQRAMNLVILAMVLCLVGSCETLRRAKDNWGRANVRQSVAYGSALGDEFAGTAYVSPSMMRQIKTKDNRILEFNDLLEMNRVFAAVRDSRQALSVRRRAVQSFVRAQLLAPVVNSISETSSNESSRDLVERLEENITNNTTLSEEDSREAQRILSRAVQSAREVITRPDKFESTSSDGAQFNHNDTTTDSNSSSYNNTDTLSRDSFSEESQHQKEAMGRTIKRELMKLEERLQSTLNAENLSAGDLDAPYYQLLRSTADTALGGRAIENLYNVENIPPGFDLYVIPIVVSFQPGRATRLNHIARVRLDLTPADAE